MRILLLTTYFRPESAANAVLMTQLAEELTEQGHRVTVITAMPHYDKNRIWDEYRGRLWMRERRGEINIHRVYIYVPPHKTSLVGRLLNYASFNLLSTLAGLMAGKHDVLLVPSPPLTNGVFGFVISRLRGMPFIYNVQDLYPDVAVRLGILKNPRVIRFFEAMERFVYHKAAGVSVISDDMRRNLMGKGVPEDKLVIIPNFVNTEFVKPLPRKNCFSQEQQFDDKFVALFAGNVGLSQGLEIVIEAAERLKDIPDLLFAIVGDGSAKAGLVAEAEKRGLHNIRFLPWQPYERVPELYSAADVCLATLRRGITEDSVPSKLYTIMGVARPILASLDSSSDTWRMIEQAGSGLCVEPEDAKALAEAVLTLYNDREKAAELGRRGRAFVEAHHTQQRVAQQYQEFFARVLAQRGKPVPTNAKV
jgi:colanic acid biosynthesis glycosyl transferase WcaI